MYQVGIKNILGLKVTGDYFIVEPCIPPEWPKFSIVFHAHGARYDIQVSNLDGVESGIRQVEVDGQAVVDRRI
jgi:cyclic beta-1,2-glucan synthetase